MSFWKSLDVSDRSMIAGIIASLIVWWLYTGKNRYGIRGVHNG